MEHKLKTSKKREVVDITDRVQAAINNGAAAMHVFTAHTTCALTTADLDPGTDQDLLDAVWDMLPKQQLRHPNDPSHATAHLASSIIGPGVVVPVIGGRLTLGAWQRIILVELDGPRERTVFLTNL